MTDCRSSSSWALTDSSKTLSVLCVGPSKNWLVPTDGGFVMGSAGDASDAQQVVVSILFHGSAVGAR